MKKLSLRACRVNAKLTQAGVAKLMNVDISTIRNWETGKTTPNIAQAIELCRIYGVDINEVDFFYDKD